MPLNLRPTQPIARLCRPLLMGLLLIGAGAARARTPLPPHVDLELLADRTAAVPGQTLVLAAVVDIEPGWHIYWHNPGDSGQATRIVFKTPEGYTAGSLRWPIPQRFETSAGAVTFGYQDSAAFTAIVTVPPDAQPGEAATFHVQAHWLACKDLCLPGQAAATLTLPIAASSAPNRTALFESLPLPMTLPQARDRVTIEVRGGPPSGAWDIELHWIGTPPSDIRFFPAADDALLLGKPTVTPDDRGVTTIHQPVRPLQGLAPPKNTLPMLVRWTEPDGTRQAVTIPLPPEVFLRATDPEGSPNTPAQP